ncbi:MAG: DUF4433 domain-containing protein [Chloroflexi bacterium]|nr:DUF4433 domain-containing protein [Chloroflexota bacterium]
MSAPENPKIYHITHVDNLPLMVTEGGVWSHAAMMAKGGPEADIGMSTIKHRRLALPVKCHPGDYMGDYVPFYFCPRSIMLYVIHCSNHPELSYRGGQGPIVHLESNLLDVVNWANERNRRWAFTLSNAGGSYAEFRNGLDDLGDIDWSAVEALDFRPPQVKEGKQAEFLMKEFFPWELVSRIGVRSATTLDAALSATKTATHQPAIRIMTNWYY